MLLLERVLEGVAGGDHRRHVDIVERGQQRGGFLRRLEPLGDRLAQAGHLDALLAASTGSGCRRCGGRGRDHRGGAGGLGLSGSDHVFLGQAAILAGALHDSGIDPVFEDRAAHRR